MGEQLTDSFWRGPVRTPARAASIANVAGWVFVVMGGLALANCLREFGNDKTIFFNSLWAALLFLIPGGLILAKSRVAAGFMGGFASLAAVLCLGGTVMGLVSREGRMAFVLVPLGLVWGLLAWLAWRALAATIAFHRLKKAAASATPESKV